MSLKVAAVLIPILLLVLSCAGRSSTSLTPRPIITTTVERVLNDYEANPILGRDLYDGRTVRVTGVMYTIEEASHGYRIALGTGEAESGNVIVCEASLVSYQNIGSALEVHGIMRGSSVDNITIEECFPYGDTAETVQSRVIRIEDQRASRREIRQACEVLASAGYEIADDSNWTPSEERTISRAAIALGHTSDMVLAVLSAIIIVEGPNARIWCSTR